MTWWLGGRGDTPLYGVCSYVRPKGYGFLAVLVGSIDFGLK